MIKSMRFGGVFPQDVPDRGEQWRRRLLDMPAPIMGLIPQPSLEDTDSIGISSGQDMAGYASLSVSITYMLWRNAADHSDPVNLAVLSEQQRVAIETLPSWPRPQWLLERVQNMRYFHLWEAVRTTWNRDLNDQTSLVHQLVDHANYVLNNQYQDAAVPPGFTPVPRLASNAVNSTVTVVIDGVTSAAAEINTDPFVYAIGAETAPHTVVTAVLPRSELEHIQIAFATRPIINTKTQ